MGTSMTISDYMYDLDKAMSKFKIYLEENFNGVEKDIGEFDTIFQEWFSNYIEDN